MSKTTICIVGFGRLGQTLAGILKPHFSLAVYEIDPKNAHQAQQGGFDVVDIADIDKYNTVILCVPIGKFEAVLRDIATRLAPDTLVMDTCSVKAYPARLMTDILPNSISIIATHPLFGPDSIGKGLENLTIVTHPVRSDRQLYQKWDQFWYGLGLNVIAATPEQHDRATAFTLGMAHFFGRIMDELQLEPQAITTVSYQALYEVMQQTNRDSWQLFHDMQHYNPYAVDMRDSVYGAIRKVEAKLDQAVSAQPK